MLEPNMRSGLAEFGIKPWPIGTLAEVKAAGFDPAKVASCSPDERGKVRGCPVWADCQFHLARNGGFKGEGPEYVRYRLNTGESVKEDFCSCFVYTQIMRRREIAGRVAIMQGMSGERIRILTDPSGEYVTRRWVEERPGDISPTARMKLEQKVLKCPKFVRPGETDLSSYAALLAERERLDMEKERQLEDAIYGADDDTLEMGATAEMPEAEGEPATAEPVEEEPAPMRTRRARA